MFLSARIGLNLMTHTFLEVARPPTLQVVKAVQGVEAQKQLLFKLKSMIPSVS